VGASYKYQGRQAAILHGLDIVGPNLRALVERMAYYARDNTLLIHCWRGGMRSQSMAWLASLNGYQTYTLEGAFLRPFQAWVVIRRTSS
jgi:tRNA 2-selenouridine synthase